MDLGDVMETVKLTKEAEQYMKPRAFEHFLMALFEQLGYHVVYQKKQRTIILIWN